MKMTRRILSWVLAIALVVTCGITGLVLPVVAEEAPADLLNGQGTFEDGTTPSSTALSDLVGKADAVIVDNPSGEGKVLQIGKFVDEDSDGVNDGAYTHVSYPKWKKLYNAETGKYDLPMTAGKSYTLTMDVYGDGVGLYFQGKYHVTSENADDDVGGKNGWFQVGNGAEEWKTYTFVFYTDEDIAEKYHSDWWSWGMSFSKTASDSCQPGNGFTYIDNVTLVETQATEIAINESDFAMEPGDVAEALTVTATPARAAYADIVWSSDAEGVAKVDAKTGVITAVANGTATITATAGALTDTVKVKVQKDKTQTWADLSKAYYTAGDNKNQNVTVNTDAATGLEYFSVNGSASVCVPNWCGTVEQGQMVGLTFLVRVTDAANNAGNVRGAVQMQSLVEGYVQPEFYARSTAMGGGWERVTFYAREEYVDGYPFFEFIYLASGTTAATPSYDVADVSVFLPGADDVNRFGAGADFEEGYAPVALGNYQQADLLTKADAAIVDDPTGADNKVFYISSASANSGAGAYLFAAALSYHNESGVRQAAKIFENTKMYKITFRVYSASKVAIDSYGGASFKGTTGTAAKSGQWRTVTTYMYTTSSFNSAYALHVRFYGEAYIDDLEMYECVDATGFEIKGDKEMTLPNSQTFEVEAVPKHAFPGTLTWSVEGAGLTLSGATLTTAYVKGTTVTGGTVTVTSDLLGADGNPIKSTFDVKVNYPKDLFPNGTFDTGNDAGIKFGSQGTSWDYVEGAGVDSSRAIKFMTTGAKYMTGTTRYFRPNSLYRFSLLARCETSGVADLELNYVTGNTADSKVYGTGTMSNISSEWTYYYYYLVTGDAPNNSNSNYNFYVHVRGLGTDSAPIYVDNISCELIEQGDNMLPSDITDHPDYKFGGTIKSATTSFGFTTDPTDSKNGVITINNSSTTAADVTGGFPYLDAYAMYELTFDSKVNQAWIDEKASMNFYIGEDTVVDGVVTAERRGDNEFYDTGAVKQTTEWQSNKVVIFTNSKARIGANTLHFNIAKGTGTGNGILYIDNLQLRRVDKGHSVHATHSNAYRTYVSIDGTSWSQYIADVPVGTTVHVRTWGNAADKTKVLKSVTARGESGTVSILNKDIVNGYTADNFGKEGADTRTFQFVMGEGVQVKTTLQSATTNNFYMNTVGTSLRYTGDTNYDGIRFLTRLSFSEGLFDADAVEGFTLTKDGTAYTVVELGSYLKRYSETESVEDELTDENALWTSVAYRKGDAELGDMKILDYTNYYIDFTSVMLKGEAVEQEVFNARKYTARGYMILEAADGSQITVLADSQVSASVNEIAPLVG